MSLLLSLIALVETLLKIQQTARFLVSHTPMRSIDARSKFCSQQYSTSSSSTVYLESDHDEDASSKDNMKGGGKAPAPRRRPQSKQPE